MSVHGPSLPNDSPSSPPSTTAPSKHDKALSKLESAAKSLLTDAEFFVECGIATDDDLASAAQYRVQARNAIDGFEALLRPGIKDLHEAHRKAVSRLNSLIDPLIKADKLLARAQGDYETAKRRAREEEARRIIEAAEARRLAEMEKELEEADIVGDLDLVEELQEEIAAPPLQSLVPVVHRPTKIQGGSTTVKWTFDWVDIRKIDPAWIVDQIEFEVRDRGDCDWLRKKIQSAVKLLGPKAIKLVGEGSITVRDEVKVGIRRNTKE